MIESLKIGDVVETPPVHTVIRLEQGKKESETIATDFVFTSEVFSHVTVLCDALMSATGRGFFLQGDFGSGKTHFLAVLSAWLNNAPGSEVLEEKHGGLKKLKESGKKFITADVSLIRFRSATLLERIIVESVQEALKEKLSRPVRLTPLAVFLEELKETLKQEEPAMSFAKEAGIKPEEISTFIEKRPRKSYTLGINVYRQMGIESPESLVEERHETFRRMMDAVQDAGYDGLVVLLDELSEFFRSKPDARALNEDARTLQLFGELTAESPLWILGAVQESIERTGDIAQVTFRKIKDRFPVKFALSSVHIKSLIEKRLRKWKPAAQSHIQGIYDYLRRQFGSFQWTFEDFYAVYPVHPLTISLLDGLSDLFSVHRGIVDFVHTRIAGDPSRGIRGILDRACYELLGPDSIYDHFSQKMAEFSAFHIYPRHIVPHLDETIDRIIVEEEDRMLARRIVRILVLYQIHPTEKTPPMRELTELAACAIADQDPDLNYQFVSEVILDPLCLESKFLVKRPSKSGDPLDAAYEVVSREDPTKNLKARLAQVASDIPDDDTRLLTSALSALPESSSWPGPAVWSQGVRRTVKWRQSAREAFVLFLDPAVAGDEEDIFSDDRINRVLEAEKADFSVLVTVGKSSLKNQNCAVWQIPFPPGEKNLEILKEYFAARQISESLKPSNPAEAPLIQHVKELLKRLEPAAQQQALDLFYQGTFTYPDIKIDPVVKQLKVFNRILEEAGNHLLELRYPGFREIEPKKVEPFPRLYQRLLDEFVIPGSLTLRETHVRGLSDAIEGLAKPLGMAAMKAGNYLFSPDPESHPLLSYLFSHIRPGGTTATSELMHKLETGKYGVPRNMARFLIAALAHGGLITLLKNGRTISVDFLQLNSVENADTVAPGELINRNDRNFLLQECTFLESVKKTEAFGLRKQRDIWRELIKYKEKMNKILEDMRKQMASMEDFSAFQTLDRQRIQSLVSGMENAIDEIKISYTARDGLERFVRAWRGSGITADDVEYILKTHKFFQKYAAQIIFINYYIRHSAVEAAASEDEQTAEYREKILELVNDLEKLILEDQVPMLTDLFERYRNLYAHYYAARHNEYYGRFEKKKLSRYADRALSLLEKLASVETLDKPEGLDALIQDLRGADRRICNRNLTEELMRAPVCSCDYEPQKDDTTPEETQKPEDRIEGFLNDYLDILKGAKVREAVSARIYAVAEVMPESAERLKRFSRFIQDQHSSAAGLLDVLDDIVLDEISRALSGRIKIERRSFKSLERKLRGRRLTPNQLYDVFREWISLAPEDSVISIEDVGAAIDEDETQTTAPSKKEFSWWKALHPELFREQEPRAVSGLEAKLENTLPVAEFKDELKRFNAKQLYDFILNEKFHLHAVRCAWLILAERVLGGEVFPTSAEFKSQYYDREKAVRITDRLTALKRFDTLHRQNLPEALKTRLPLADMLVDSWITNDLRSTVLLELHKIAARGDEWLSSLKDAEPLILKEYPIVLILDGVAPDVWLQATENLGPNMLREFEISWRRLTVPPKTRDALAAMFDFTGDPVEEFHARDIPYVNVKGDETSNLEQLLPPYSEAKPLIIRIALIDKEAHSARMRLPEMPAVVARALESELPFMKRLAVSKNVPLIITADHGMSLTPKGLTHGKGGVYEEAVFRAALRFSTGKKKD